MMVTLYWGSTILLSSFLLLSSYTYFFSASTIAGLRELGFPDFFRIQLGVLKLIAVFAILFPNLPVYVRDWGYAGTGCFLITAIVAHIAHKDSILILALLVLLSGLLVLSRYSLSTIIS